uniref:Metalloserrulase 17 n=1 Tax=Tityus serrulatus TaxID=6887 RepID=A0A1S5QNT5_TITSE|nr:metalloserrulase 17 [Tityus serrulatus]
MIVYLAIALFYDAVSAVPTGREDVAYPNVETFRSGVKRIKFRALDQNIDLRLESAANLISDDFELYEGDGNRIRKPVDIDRLKRKMYRNRETSAAFYIDEDGPLTINGIINSKLRIEPYESEAMIKDGVRAHRIIEIKRDENYIRLNDQIIPPGIRKVEIETETQRSTNNCILVELVFLIESNLTYRYKNNDETILKECYIIVTVMNSLAQSLKLNLTIQLQNVIKFTEKNEPSFIANSVIPEYPHILDSELLIANMGTHYRYKRDVSNGDIVLLLMDRKMGVKSLTSYSLQLGLGYVGAACESRYKFGIAVYDSKLDVFYDTCVHECAHVMGSPHDGDPPVSHISNSPGSIDCLWKYGHIMSYKYNIHNSTLFSSCSRNNIAHLCLTIKCLQCK